MKERGAPVLIAIISLGIPSLESRTIVDWRSSSQGIGSSAAIDGEESVRGEYLFDDLEERWNIWASDRREVSSSISS